MSFFGFDPTMPRDQGHNARAPGFGSAPDPFAGLGGNDGGDDDQVYAPMIHSFGLPSLTLIVSILTIPMMA